MQWLLKQLEKGVDLPTIKGRGRGEGRKMGSMAVLDSLFKQLFIPALMVSLPSGCKPSIERIYDSYIFWKFLFKSANEG